MPGNTNNRAKPRFEVIVERIMKINIKRLVLLSTVLICLLLAGFLVTNSIDEELIPEIPVLIKKMEQPVKKEGNAFYYLVAIKADTPSNEIINAGKTTYENYNKDNNGQYKPYKEIKLATEQLKLCTPGAGIICLADYKKNVTEYRNLWSQNNRLLDRYRFLLGHELYEEPLNAFPLVAIDITEIHKLYLSSLGWEWSSGIRESALTGLYQSQEFWRMVIASRVSMQIKVKVLGILSMNLSLLSEMLGDCDDCKAYKQQIDELLKPFTLKEISMSEAVWMEYAASFVELEKMKGNIDDIFISGFDEWLLTKFYKVNTTHNFGYELAKHNAKYLGLSPEEFDLKGIEYQEFIDEYSRPSLFEYFTNYSKSMLREMAIPLASSYYNKSVDLVGLQKRINDKYSAHLQ